MPGTAAPDLLKPYEPDCETEADLKDKTRANVYKAFIGEAKAYFRDEIILIPMTIFRESKGWDSESQIFNRWCLVTTLAFKPTFRFSPTLLLVGSKRCRYA